MKRQPVRIEIIVEDGDTRTLLKVYDDNSEERIPVVKTPKKTRQSPRSYWYWGLATGRRRFF